MRVAACNENPTNDWGVSAKLIAPGSSADSVILTRMRAAPGSQRMPPLATNMVDTAGAAVIEDWINALSGCTP